MTRMSKGHSGPSSWAYVYVLAARNRNKSVKAAMNKHYVLYPKINERAVTGKDFKISLHEIKFIWGENEMLDPILIIDNARIHQYRGLSENAKVSRCTVKYLPPYFFFLNTV